MNLPNGEGIDPNVASNLPSGQASRKWLWALGSLLVLLTWMQMPLGCRSTKSIEKAISSSKKDTATVVVVEDRKADSMRFINDVFAKIQKNTINFKTFSAKMKVNYEGSDGRSYELTAFLRILKDSIIWVRGEAILGFEAFRALITPDSVKIISKLDKTITLRSVSYLQDVAKVPLNFKSLQDLLIGNSIYLDSNIVFYRLEDQGISLMCMGDLFKNYVTINSNDYTLRHMKLDDADVMRARTCDVTYRDYDLRDSIRFSTYRKISLAEKSKFDLEISFKQYNFNDNLSFPFPVPKNYKHK
jgi:Domain of unknown function (DUF4292)